MRLLIAAAMLGGCATVTDEPSAGRRCDATGAQPLVGRAADVALRDEALRLSGARSIRVIAPGTAVTMDYREDRVNLEVDAANIVTNVRCG